MLRISIKCLLLLFSTILSFSCEEESDYRDIITGIYQCTCNHKGYYYNGVHHNSYREIQTKEEIQVEKTAIDNDTLIVINRYGTVIFNKDYSFYDDNSQGFKRDLFGKFFIDLDSISFGGYDFSRDFQADSITFSRDHSYMCAGKKKK